MNWWTRPSEWNPAAASPAEPLLLSPGHRYFAFLSYSHQDEPSASWLHSALEQFRVPSSLAGRLTEQGVTPKRLTPIFRDRHELAAADDLGTEIRTALAASRFLIVLCSPAAAQSKWTNAEIDAFKRSRPDGCVIAAIIDGEPFASELPGREAEECFPPALRHRYDKRGRPTAKRSEPLAADLRDNRDGKRLGLLKIVAAMLGVGLDDLVQRDHLRRQRRLGFIATGAIAGMLVTSSLAVAAFTARDEARDQRREAEGLVGFMLGDLKEKLQPLGRLDVLDSVGTRALEYFEKQNQGSLTDEALTQRARALTLIGEIANIRGDLPAALRRYQEAAATTAEAVRRHPDDPQRLFDHAQNVFWVGYIAYQRGQPSQAAALFSEYKRLAGRMVALAPDKTDYRLEEMYANNNLGTVLMDQHRFREAAANYESSLAVVERLIAADPRNAEYKNQLGINYAWLADAYEYGGNLERAIAIRERQLALLEELARTNSADTQSQRTKMTAHRAIGRLLASRGETAAGLKQALAGVAISDGLYRVEPDNTEWLQANAAGRMELADLQLAIGRLDDAASTIRAACDIADRLVQRDSSVADWKALLRVNCLMLRARLALGRGETAQAVTLANDSAAAAQGSPNEMERKLLSFAALATAGDALAASANRNAAQRAWRDAVSALPPGVELKPREQAQLVAVYARLGYKKQAERLATSLSTMGYQHPAYLKLGRQAGIQGG